MEGVCHVAHSGALSIKLVSILKNVPRGTFFIC